MDESKQTGSRMAAEGSGSASMACGAVHRQTPKAGARCVNSARRDLCGGYPVTGIPTATYLPGEKINRNLPFCWLKFNHFPPRLIYSDAHLSSTISLMPANDFFPPC